MKTIIITGAAFGVGKTISKTLQDQQLILVDRDEKGLKEIAKALDVAYYVCDVSDSKQLDAFFKWVIEEYAVIDCLINNAGMWIGGSMSEVNDQEFMALNHINRIKEVIDTNLYGPIAMIRTLAPQMMKQGFGQIININSQSGVKTEEPYPIYNATKTGGTAFRKAIQEDLGRMNIRITDICPGLINTDFYKRADVILPEEILDLGLSPQDIADAVKYVLELPEHICIPSLEIMNIKSYG